MTALDFPTSPAVGQVYDKYSWDGEKWFSTLGGTPGVLWPPLDGLSSTGAWSASRKILAAYGGAYFTPSGSPTRANPVLDQSGNSRNLTPPSGGGALVGGTSPETFVFNGNTAANTFLQSGVSTLITTTSAYMIISAKIAAWTGNGVTLMMCQGLNYGLGISGTGSLVYALTYPSSVSISGLALNTPYVFEYRIEGGGVYLRVNGTGEVSVSASTGQPMSNINLGGRWLSNCMDGSIFEAATFSTVPTMAQRNALVQNFGRYVGASV
jgi:hypothetical protein